MIFSSNLSYYLHKLYCFFFLQLRCGRIRRFSATSRDIICFIIFCSHGFLWFKGNLFHQFEISANMKNYSFLNSFFLFFLFDFDRFIINSSKNIQATIVLYFIISYQISHVCTYTCTYFFNFFLRSDFLLSKIVEDHIKKKKNI